MCKMHVKLSYWCPSFYNELSIITTSASVFQIARVCWLSRRDLSGPVLQTNSVGTNHVRPC